MSRRPRFLRHLTIDTGHVRDSYRAEVGDEVVAVLRPLLDRADAGERVPIPGTDPPTHMRAQRTRDRGLRVWLEAGDDPLVDIAIAPSSLSGAVLWSVLEQSGPPPSAPWCAVALRGGLMSHPQAMGWLGDLERCLAWAWIDRG